MNSAPAPTPIAVVGISALFPGSTHKQAFWRNIVDGRDFISEVPADHWLLEDYYDPDPTQPGKVYTRRGAFLPAVPLNPMEFGLPPTNLPSTDSVQLLALLGAKQLLGETRSVQSARVARRDVSVILGIAAGTELIGQMAARIQRPHWVEGMRQAGLGEKEIAAACERIAATYPEWTESTFPGLLANVVAGRIANRFDLGGANCVIDAACASSLAAFAMAVDELRLGKADLVISGGCDALNDIFMFTCFTRTPAMSRAGDCRPFSDAADGTLLGEGVGLFALRRLADAERDGDAIYAVIRGVGSSSDGSAKSVYAPRAEGQAVAIRRALAEAGVTPREIGLIEGHGTATKAGDAAEVAGLKQAFAGDAAGAGPWCALGSIKSQIGHAKSAAGAAGLFKVVMALRHKLLPPTIKVGRPNPALELERSPFFLNTTARPWVSAPGRPRRAGLSSFGFGGSNYHLVLEEYLGAGVAPRIPVARTQLFLFSGATRAVLQGALEGAAAELGRGAPAAAVARASQVAFDPRAAHRLAVLAADLAGLAETAAFARGKLAGAEPAWEVKARAFYSSKPPAAAGTVAFLFPGQGSQYVGMGAELAMEFDAARAVWDRAAAEPGPALHESVFPPPAFDDAARQVQEAELTRTETAQPAIGLVSLAQLALLTQAGVRPDFVGGHSYGELVALHAAGVIREPGALLALSRARGRIMAETAAANSPGAMLAIVGRVDDLPGRVARNGSPLVIANHNSPQQVVVAGAASAISALEQELAGDKSRTVQRLPVSAAFHSPQVAAAGEAFGRELERADLAPPQRPVFSNTTGARHAGEVDTIRSLLARQLAEPVRFQAQVDAMYAAGARVFVEVGPRSVLTRLVGQILGDRPHLAVGLDQKGRSGVEALLDGLAQLSVHGLAVDFAALWSGFETEQPDPAATPPARGLVWVNGTNLGKPYPPPNGAAGRTPPASLTKAAPVGSVSAAALAAPASTVSHSSPVPPPPSSSDAAHRYALLEQVQRNVLEAHRHFQETMAQSHLAFLQTSEALLRQVAGGATGGNGTNGHAHVAPPALPALPALPRPAPVVTMPTPAPLAARVLPRPTVTAAPAAPAPAVRVEIPVAVPPAPVPRAAPAAASPAPAPAADATDHAAIILQTVAQSTGYPAEMIQMDMELESGLGIDSIKKVEIFAALQAMIPALAGADATQVGNLTTLQAILDFTTALTGGAPAGQKKN